MKSEKEKINDQNKNLTKPRTSDAALKNAETMTGKLKARKKVLESDGLGFRASFRHSRSNAVEQ